jgi:hypothetical protein
MTSRNKDVLRRSNREVFSETKKKETLADLVKDIKHDKHEIACDLKYDTISFYKMICMAMRFSLFNEQRVPFDLSLARLQEDEDPKKKNNLSTKMAGDPFDVNNVSINNVADLFSTGN